jgi:hypothetical protein
MTKYIKYLFAYFKYIFVYTPFELELNMLGICNSYHFEFDAKSFELIVKGNNVRVYERNQYSSKLSNKYFGVVKSSNNISNSTIFHLYTSKTLFYNNNDIINPKDLNIVIWLKVGWLNIVIYTTVILILLASFILGMVKQIILEPLPLAFFGIIFTLALMYKPDKIAEIILRPWKVRITMGGLMFAAATLISYIDFVFPTNIFLMLKMPVLISFCGIVINDNILRNVVYTFNPIYQTFFVLYVIYIIYDIFIRSIVSRCLCVDLKKYKI